MNGYIKKAPIQDYSAEIDAVQEEDKVMLDAQRDILVQQEEAAKAKARKNILNGLIGALCIGLAVASGGTSVPLLAACIFGGTAVVTGVSTTIEGVTSAEKILRGDYSGVSTQ